VEIIVNNTHQWFTFMNDILHKSLHYTRGTGVKTYAKGGADAQLGEKQ
jgi:hypothetical protein